MLEDDRHLPIGYDFENADAYGVDLSRTFCYLISGKSGSGKTNLLKILLRTACRKKGTLALIDFDGECSNQRIRYKLPILIRMRSCSISLLT